MQVNCIHYIAQKIYGVSQFKGGIINVNGTRKTIRKPGGYDVGQLVKWF